MLTRAVVSLIVDPREAATALLGQVGRLEGVSRASGKAASTFGPSLSEVVGIALARGLRLGLERKGELVLLDAVDVVDGEELACDSSYRRLLASIFWRTILRRSAGI